MATTSDFRNGMVIDLDNTLYSIVEFQHVKPGKGNAFVRTRLKNVLTGAVIDKTFRAGERVEEVRLERRPMQYLYNSNDLYYFMDVNTYEQNPVSRELFEDQIVYLKENTVCDGLVHNEKIIGIELPFFLELKVIETPPGVKGDTVAGGTKAAKLETGVVVQVPLFINEGDIIKIDRRSMNI